MKYIQQVNRPLNRAQARYMSRSGAGLLIVSLPHRVKLFFSALFLTAFLPYVPYILPVIPGQLFGLNMTGWAWTLILVFTLFQFARVKRSRFPWQVWLPWMVYLAGYLMINFSHLGLQLTCQYLLPLLIGMVAASFTYSDGVLLWLFRQFFRLCLAVIGMFVIGYLFRGGYTPAAAATPMLLSVLVALTVAAYNTWHRNRYLALYGALFLVPFIDMTRTGIAVFIALFVAHFANRNIKMKVWSVFIGAALAVGVFYSPNFQEKSFQEGAGSINDVQLNYYDNQRLNNNGRLSWKLALEPGLERSPWFGNGPRADNAALSLISGLRGGEAHNDYLSVAYNYGYVGLTLLLAGFTLTFAKLWAVMRRESNTLRYMLITSTMTLFIGFAMFMYTDNILKYTIYFPNIFFAMVGISFARHHDRGKGLPLQISRSKQPWQLRNGINRLRLWRGSRS